MGIVPNASGPVVAALSTTTKVIEAVIIAVVVVLIAVTIVLYRRKSSPAKPAAANQKASSQYYGDVASLPNVHTAGSSGAMGTRSDNDPFAGFAAGSPSPVGSAAPPAWAGQGSHGAAAAPFSAGPAVGVAPAPAPGVPAGAFTPPPPAPSPAPTPPPGTPAGWLPEPSGMPDTLRYWDGAAWTQHVAQRS